MLVGRGVAVCAAARPLHSLRASYPCVHPAARAQPQLTGGCQKLLGAVLPLRGVCLPAPCRVHGREAGLQL